MYADLQERKKILYLLKGCQSFVDSDLFPPDQNPLIILNIVLFKASNHPRVTKISTQNRHHRNMSIFMVTQNVLCTVVPWVWTAIVWWLQIRDKNYRSIFCSPNLPLTKSFFPGKFRGHHQRSSRTLFCPEPYSFTSGWLFTFPKPSKSSSSCWCI